MKSIEVKLYKFNELSEEVKEKVLNNWRTNDDYWFTEDANKTFERFADLFNIAWQNIDYCEPYRNDYKIKLSDDVLYLSGSRLCAYIWNNYKNDLFPKKYLKSFDGHKKHKNIVNYTAKNTGKKYCNYYSSIKKDNSCVLTGVCYDDDILSPIYEFLNKPSDRIDFETLLNDCIYSLCASVNAEIEYQSSEEAITETIEANDYDFTEDGKLY